MQCFCKIGPYEFPLINEVCQRLKGEDRSKERRYQMRTKIQHNCYQNPLEPLRFHPATESKWISGHSFFTFHFCQCWIKWIILSTSISTLLSMFFKLIFWNATPISSIFYSYLESTIIHAFCIRTDRKKRFFVQYAHFDLPGRSWQKSEHDPVRSRLLMHTSQCCLWRLLTWKVLRWCIFSFTWEYRPCLRLLFSDYESDSLATNGSALGTRRVWEGN